MKTFYFHIKNPAAFLILLFLFTPLSQAQIQREYNTNTPSAICNYTWNNQVSGTSQQLRSVKAVSDMVAWAAGAAGTVRKTTDGGLSWSNGNQSPGVLNGLIYNIEAIDADNAWCTTSTLPVTTSFIYKTTNGGVTWTQVFSQAGGFINSIIFRDANNGFAQGDPVSSRWSLWKSTDAGATWDSSGMYLPQAGPELGWYNSMFEIGDIIWFGTDNTRVYKSTNYGLNWTFAATATLLNSYNLHFNNTTVGMACGTSIVKTTDGGATYANVSSVPGAGSITGIEGKDNDFWYVRGTGIFRSTNAGTNWTQVYTLPGTGSDMDFHDVNDCLTGWVVGAGGMIAKMTGVSLVITNNNTEIPDSYKLEQNFPNPFNPTTDINFSLRKTGNVEMVVYDVLGKEAATLLKDFLPAGSYTIKFDASELTSGVYFYKMSAGDFTEIKKMMLRK